MGNTTVINEDEDEVMYGILPGQKMVNRRKLRRLKRSKMPERGSLRGGKNLVAPPGDPGVGMWAT